MIFDAMRLMQTTLQDYILQCEPTLGTNPIVVVDNIAMAEQLGGSNSQLNGHVVMSLVNLQEETTLKNSPYYRVEKGRTIYQNPPVYLNLFILFSVLHNQYDTALRLLTRVVECFQSQTDISFATTPTPGNLSQDVKIVPDLYSLTFEQLNQLWGSLGGKQVPFVLYRARLVTIEAQKRQGEGAVITEAHTHEPP
jgi:Pvc16 N-terminal domain